METECRISTSKQKTTHIERKPMEETLQIKNMITKTIIFKFLYITFSLFF